MKNLHEWDSYRIKHPAGYGDHENGAFRFKLIKESRLEFQVIVSSGDGWEHVSVSLEERCPRWNEMQAIKEMFFHDYEIVMQLHPAKSDYVNIHPNCLHLWRPINQIIPTPPREMV